MSVQGDYCLLIRTMSHFADAPVAALERLRELAEDRVAWDVTPAMYEARIEQYERQIERLRELAEEAEAVRSLAPGYDLFRDSFGWELYDIVGVKFTGATPLEAIRAAQKTPAAG